MQESLPAQIITWNTIFRGGQIFEGILVMVTVVMEKRNSVLDMVTFLPLPVLQNWAETCTLSFPNQTLLSRHSPSMENLMLNGRSFLLEVTMRELAWQCLCDPAVKIVRFNTLSWIIFPTFPFWVSSALKTGRLILLGDHKYLLSSCLNLW